MLGIPVTKHEGDDLEAEYPMVDLTAYDFGVSDDSAGYSDGADAASGLARAALRAGATVVTGVGVTDITVRQGEVADIKTDAGPIACNDVVIAAGPWTARLAEAVGVDVPILVEREQVVVLDPPSEFKQRHLDRTPTTATPGGEWYLRPDFGEGLLVATHHTADEVDPDDYDDSPDEETLLSLGDELTDLLPGLGDAGIKGKYCGVYSTTPDHDFVLDQSGPEGCYLACGFSGHGFKHGPAVGKIMTDLITKGESDLVNVEYFSLDRFDDDPEGHQKPDNDV